jgi:inner membrane protein
MWLVLVTHPLLDAMTVYGTQLALPFTDHPYGVASIFIVDPLYTLPLLAGGIWALVSRGTGRGLTANAVGLALSTAYLGWTFAAQQHVETVTRASLARQGIAAERLLVSPTAFNSLLWRVLVMEGGRYHEGFYSLLDADRTVRLDAFDQGVPLARELPPMDGVQRIMAFSHGFYKLHQDGSRVLITDLRMGQEPAYTFTFAVAQRNSPPVPLARIEQVPMRLDLARGLPWLWHRALGEPLPPPR